MPGPNICLSEMVFLICEQCKKEANWPVFFDGPTSEVLKCPSCGSGGWIIVRGTETRDGQEISVLSVSSANVFFRVTPSA